MTDAARADVVIVGGGPAGASTAWALARNGVDVLVVAPAPVARSAPQIGYVRPSAITLLSEMGALDAMRSAGASPVTQLLLQATSSGLPDEEVTAALPANGMTIDRAQVGAILRDRARAVGARILEGVRAHDVLRDARGRVSGVRVQATRPDPAQPLLGVHTCGARVVVAADGGAAGIARLSGIAPRARTTRRLVYRMHLSGVGGVGASRALHLFADGCCEVVTSRDGGATLTLVVPGQVAGAATLDAEAYLDGWLASHPRVSACLGAARRHGARRVEGPVSAHSTHAPRSWAPGIALVGDAAHGAAAIGGDGLHTALHGGVTLGSYLFEALRAPSPVRADHALEAYERSRRHAFSARWRTDALVSAALTSPALFARVARSFEQRPAMTDLIGGALDGLVPARMMVRPGVLWQLFGPPPGRQGFA